ncbi:transmembrane protease serine 9-like [Erythrolamprus reginae]|uniref:transmembrane protease serine 9-like n=1 Tax=Erythrolamprus reginae TaxID=121349 RepID=UPI00396CB6B6
MERLRGGLSLAGLLWLLAGLLVAGVVREARAQVLCGVPALGRIVGGSSAQSGQWPWQANLNYNSHHVCGATLIAPQWLVSAAHCFPKGNEIPSYEVSLGSFQLKNPSSEIQVRLIEEVIKHPDFNEDEGSRGDIALVKLKTAVQYSRTVRPICLPDSSANFPQGLTCTVTGWGNVHESTSLASPMTLQQLEVPIIGLDTCRCLYRRNPDPEESHTLHPDMMCAGYVEGKKDACQGDSGGPLSCHVDSAWVLAGVVSWGSSCGAPNRPGVYIRLAAYADWVKKNVPEVQLQQVTVPTVPPPKEALCSNSTEGGKPYDDMQPLPGWNRPIPPEARSGVLCGVPALARIVGGSSAQHGQWPWQAKLNYNGQHACGATLITPQWLVSAAHCFPKVNDITLYEVSLGSIQLQPPPPDVEVRIIEQVIKHPDFNEEEGSQGDIALIKLNGPVSYSQTVRPICLPDSSVNFPQGMTCTVTGWGNVHESTSLSLPKMLQQVEVPIIGLDNCKCLYRRNPDPEETHTLHSDMMCAGYVEGKKDACQGDSGGPLSCQVDSAWVLAGVVSWGSSCGAPNRPGVYIRLAAYADWIKGNVPEVQLQQVTVPTVPGPEEDLCKSPDNSSASLTSWVGLPLLLLLFQTCLW